MKDKHWLEYVCIYRDHLNNKTRMQLPKIQSGSSRNVSGLTGSDVVRFDPILPHSQTVITMKVIGVTRSLLNPLCLCGPACDIGMRIRKLKPE